MEARVKAKCHMDYVRACSGVMFTKFEWTRVPDEHTLDALTNEYLEIKPAEVAEVVEPVKPVEHAPVVKAKGGKK